VDRSGRKRAIITGANTGIGLESAKAMKAQGYDVVLACKDEKKAEAAQQLL
jgi:NAD(P)-dependent dehydrogenase (short-subunit alcohol dehydrogenase family)